MLRNYLAAAWRGARRDRFYALLNVLGLGLGFAAAILIWLFARDELSYNRFLADYQDVYRAQLTDTEAGRPPETFGATPQHLAGELKLDFPEIGLTARASYQIVGLRRDEVEAAETILTVDPDYLTVLRFPLLSGDPKTALAQPDSIVLTRSLAMKYFGTVDCLGESLDLDRVHPVRVTAVAEDPPSNTTLGFTALLSGQSSYSSLAAEDREGPLPPGELHNSVQTFIRLKPGTAPARLAPGFPAFVDAHYRNLEGRGPLFVLFLKPIADLHLHPHDPDTAEPDDQAESLYAVAATGLLILLLAGINFVNLVTARAQRRALEVGVRKAMGGMRGQLLAQFIGESVLYALAGMLFGMALAELVLPSLNAFLAREIAFDYWRRPDLVLLPIAAALLFGAAAGVYPAILLSGFPPAAVLKSSRAGPIGGGRLRLALVVFQFTVTIALLIATTIIYRQNVFAMTEALHFDKELVLTVNLVGMPFQESPDGLGKYDAGSLEALRQRLMTVPGVRFAASSLVVPHATTNITANFDRPGRADRPSVALTQFPVDFDFFKVYGFHPLAGRELSRDRSEDGIEPNDMSRMTSALLNETGARALGFASAEVALGQEIRSDEPGFPTLNFRVVGVVPDVPFDTIRQPVPPGVYYVDRDFFWVLNLKLSGEHLAETLTGVDAAWHEFVPTHPINRSFVDQRIELLYVDITREGRLFAGFAGFAAAIGCLGLVGLSAYTAERRTKEIGIRKALGASTLDVTRMLIWQFVKPVLLANAIAWPIAWWFMRRWLDGFAYRIELDPTPFLIAGLGALVIAIATTAFHALQVARSRPVLALRYE